MLAHVLERAGAATTIDDVVLATSDRSADEALRPVAASAGAHFHAGPEYDVLRRVRDAACAARADVVVRVTGDCPLLDPDVVDSVVTGLVDDPSGADLASNVLDRTFPKGLDVEALHFDVLERICRLGRSPESREHVTWFAYRERPELFELRSVTSPEDGSQHDWSVDTADDLERVRALFLRHDLKARRLPWLELIRGS
jgi:spore coat polysaccharide biosynthesis protein SpsF